MSTLEIRNLQVSVNTDAGAVEILKGVDLTINYGREDSCHHGAKRLG